MMTDQTTTRQAIQCAATAFTLSLSSGVRQSACPFLNSHRDGECSRCVQMHEHDAEMARRWHEANN